MVEPRDWLNEPNLFGRSLKSKWKYQGDRSDVVAEQGAAWLQHQFCCGVREALDHDGRSNRWLAQAAGLKERHLSHILRGRQVVSIRTMVAIIHALERVELWPAPASLSDTRPPD